MINKEKKLRELLIKIGYSISDKCDMDYLIMILDEEIQNTGFYIVNNWSLRGKIKILERTNKGDD